MLVVAVLMVPSSLSPVYETEQIACWHMTLLLAKKHAPLSQWRGPSTRGALRESWYVVVLFITANTQSKTEGI